MKTKKAISEDELDGFSLHIKETGKASSTVARYKRNVEVFGDYLESIGLSRITKDAVVSYRTHLSKSYKTSSANTMIISLNCFLTWSGRENFRVKTLKLQRRTSLSRLISREEYDRLLSTAKAIGMERCYFIMRLLASTGIRIGEVPYITVKSLEKGGCHVTNKGKTREIFISESLCNELKNYCERKEIKSGIVFHGRKDGAMLDKSKIWRDMNKVALEAGVDSDIVHAHSFRHFFAKEYLEKFHDLPDLADILGHSSLETTRIYTRTTSYEKRMRITQLGL